MSITFNATENDGETSLTVFGPDWSKPVAGTHPNFVTLMTYLATTASADRDPNYVLGLIDPTKSIGEALQTHFGERLTFDLHHLYLDGLRVEGGLGAVIKQRMLAADQDWLRFARFLTRLEENPSKRAKDAIWGWVEKHGVTITEDGRIVGYKGLVNGKDVVAGATNVPVSVHEGPNNFVNGSLYGEAGVAYKVPHYVGSVISKRRGDVDDNNTMACSTGLHVGAYSYAKTFGENRADGARYSTMGRMADSLPNSTFALVIFAPEDVVSVPSGDLDWKIRVCKYEVSEFLEEVKDTLKDMPSYPVKTPAPYLPANEPFQQVPGVHPPTPVVPEKPLGEQAQVDYVLVEENRVRSQAHEWEGNEQAEYDSLTADGRTMYDNLRTQFDWSHVDAFGRAVAEFGQKSPELQKSEQTVAAGDWYEIYSTDNLGDTVYEVIFGTEDDAQETAQGYNGDDDEEDEGNVTYRVVDAPEEDIEDDADHDPAYVASQTHDESVQEPDVAEESPATLREPQKGSGLMGRVVLKDWADLNPGLSRDLADTTQGNTAVARKYAAITTESSVRRYRKSL